MVLSPSVPSLPCRSVMERNFGESYVLTAPGRAYLTPCAAAVDDVTLRDAGRGTRTAEATPRQPGRSPRGGPAARAPGREPMAPSRAAKKSEQELKDEEMELFTKYYMEWKGGRKSGSTSYTNIPRFYYRLPAEDEVLLQKLREESRAVFLQRKSRELLDNEELQDLENYILELIPTLPQLDGLEKSFYSFYVCTAVRKFFFFLDPLRTGKIKIQDILACSFLDDLLELRDEELSKESQETNWFSAPSALRVYGQYLNLDKDHNGMLSKEELSRYGTGTLTNIFLDRVFQECLTYDGEMDYKTYLDFVLALENRKEPAALQYIFKLLDIENKGYLNVFSLNYFFRAIQEQMKIHGQEPVSFQDVKDEIFDMVKPKDPYKISLQDLINSSQGDTVTSILIDLNGFWTYENREVLVASDNDSTADVDDT
ncbi:serine/threonine-protein phosphatase 2A regulatory subunit B'' subunit gamma isoform X3 [Pogoniulus pusillus]|uniref:serine/threonine-protein phosphatase 2A regulatory subunit B'' subunit gamma isoform X3 n=1 Tax=Pogoniulus pusillus TaxID=488313 RepID=UPI0030B9574E